MLPVIGMLAHLQTNMELARAMAAFTSDAGNKRLRVPVIRLLIDRKIGIMTRNTSLIGKSVKPKIAEFLEAGAKIPFLFVDIPCDRHFVQHASFDMK